MVHHKSFLINLTFSIFAFNVSAFLAKMQTEDWNEVRSCMIPLVSGVASIATSRNRNGGEWWRKVKGFSCLHVLSSKMDQFGTLELG